MEKGFLFKDVYNKQLIESIAHNISDCCKDFDSTSFIASIIPNLKPLSLTERSNLITQELFTYLPKSYSDALEIILNSFRNEVNNTELSGFEGFYYMPFAGYISKFGLQKEDYEQSINALLEITKRFTAENAIRPFIRMYPKETFQHLHKWTTDKNVHVRRLVSEGTRPKLPWASPLKEFQKDPAPIIELLEKLKEDKELYVRRSVANNLNDIAKDHPNLVVEILTQWNKKDNKGTKWIISHAARTLLKQGHPKALELLGYPENVKIDVLNFTVKKLKCKLGDENEFSFEIQSFASKEQNLMIDFVVHYTKANGKTAPKVFKLSKKSIPANSQLSFKKKISFKEISTRKYYPGLHEIEIQINGKRYGKEKFILDK